MRRARWFLAVSAMAIVAAGCLPSSPDAYGPSAGLPRGVTIPVHMDNGDDPAVEQAMAWIDSLAGRTLFALANNNSWDGAVWVYHVAAINCPGEEVRACTSVADSNGVEQSPGNFPYRWCDVMLNPGEGSWEVVAHEMFHCLGFGHITNRPSIMGPSDADPSGWVADQAMLRAAGY